MNLRNGKIKTLLCPCFNYNIWFNDHFRYGGDYTFQKYDKGIKENESIGNGIDWGIENSYIHVSCVTIRKIKKPLYRVYINDIFIGEYKNIGEYKSKLLDIVNDYNDEKNYKQIEKNGRTKIVSNKYKLEQYGWYISFVVDKNAEIIEDKKLNK